MDLSSRFKKIVNSGVDERLLSNLFDAIADLLEDPSRTENEREKLVVDLTKYVVRKRPTQSTDGTNELEYLKYVRSSLAHKKPIADEVIRVAIPMFWKALKAIATESNWPKISNLLAYSLRQKETYHYTENASVKTKIRKYELAFNKLQDEEKLLAFEYMLLALYSTEEFQNHLKKKRKI